MDDLERSLWHAVAANLDSLEPRLVLADYLIEHGRVERGELIVLQCRQPDDPQTVAHTRVLTRRHWDDWLGRRLAGLLDPDRSELRGGMLDDIVVGRMSTFDRAVGGARSHELWTVRTARAGMIDTPSFAQLALHADLVNLSALDASQLSAGFDCIRTFGRVQPRWERITSLALRSLVFAEAGRNIRATVDELARVFPNLVELELSHLSNRDELLALAISALPDALPSLARVRVQALGLSREMRRALEAMPHVERVS